MIVLIDNYDSFSYNLYQLAGAIVPHIRVIRNDDCTLSQLRALAPRAVLLSPGPGRPEHAGICVEAVRQLAGSIPILGVCLGHQAVCQALGADISYSAQLMHGKASQIYVDPGSALFRNMDPIQQVGRYHSLTAVRETLPDMLRVTAQTQDGEIMAVEHRSAPVYGVQFHPESILTPNGRQILENFLGGVVQ